MRRLHDLEVVVELRLLFLSEFAGNLSPDQHTDLEKIIGKQTVVFDDGQVRKLMTAAQGDQRTTIMQVPRVTLFNGQRVPVTLTQEHVLTTSLEVVNEADRIVLKPKKETVRTGLTYVLVPVVSADRRDVRVSVDLKLMDLDTAVAPFVPVMLVTECNTGEKEVPIPALVARAKISTLALNQTVTVPDGKTTLVYLGKKTGDHRSELAPSPLSSLPCIGRLFKNVGYGRENLHVVLLLSARVIDHEKEEQASLKQAQRGR